MTAFDALIDAALTLLRASPAVTSGLIGEDVDIGSLPESTQEAVSVSIFSSDPQDPAPLLGAPVDWITTLQIEAYARQDAPGPAGRASRALQARVYERLMSGNALGAAVPTADVRQPSLRTDHQVLDTRTGVTVALYPISHRTVANTLSGLGA